VRRHVIKQHGDDDENDRSHNKFAHTVSSQQREEKTPRKESDEESETEQAQTSEFRVEEHLCLHSEYQNAFGALVEFHT
jgi:hypothetical protein